MILVCKENDESGAEKCDFVLWGKPLIEKCPKCSWFLAEQKIKGTDTWRRYCSNSECANHSGIGEDESADNGAADTESVAEDAGTDEK